MRVALVGNPNCGKTTLFNALTGSNQYCGNWPGVTVEKKGGKLKADKSIEITDLPGIYSLSPYTLEEVVARNFIIEEKPDAILNIVDGSNLERNLYLTTQLLEMGIPMVIAVNMMDVVRKRGDEIYVDQLANELGCNVVEISALKNEGIDEVVNCLKSIGLASLPKPITFSAPVEEAVHAIQGRLGDSVPENLRRFYAVKLLEQDKKIVESLPGASDVSDIISKAEKECDDDTESAVINDRYTFIGNIIDHCRDKNSASQLTTSDKIDRVVTNRFLALPIFVVVMFLVYYISVTTVGTVATDWANDGVFGDGWFLGPGQEQFDEENEAFEEASENVAAFEEAAEAEGLDPSSETFLKDAEAAGLIGTYEAYDEDTGEDEVIEVDAATYEESLETLAPYQGDQEAIAAFEAAAIEQGLDPEAEDFADQAEEAGIVATYVNADGEESEVDAATYAEELEGSEPDPTQYGIWVTGIPVLVEDALASIDCVDWLQALILDGIVAGVGAVLGFVPQMLILFFMLAILESCGYLARVAFILDRIFRRFGLSGKSFIPLLIGSGCGVPGIMASRTIENQADRRMTVMTVTFIPCGAKLPVIALFAGAIFGGAWWVAPSAYFLGIATVLCSGVILKKTRFFAGEAAPFIMELPAYHLPTPGTVLRSTWERAWAFIKKACTILLLACILIWFVSTYGWEDGIFCAVSDTSYSILAAIGNAFAWVFVPQGFGDWQAAAASLSGLAAKEDIVATLGILFASEDASWYTNFASSYGYAAGYAFLAFNLIAVPCFAALTAAAREHNSKKWFWAQVAFQIGTAWVISLWVFQFAGLFTGEVTFNVFTVVAIVLFVAFLYLLFRPNKWKNVKGERAVDAA